MNKALKNILIGVALGDSWGNPNEFQSLRNLISKEQPHGPDMPDKLVVTDDTQMTLYLARALERSWNKSIPEVKKHIINGFLDYRIDPDNDRAPGVTVMGSLRNLTTARDWTAATDRYSDGSGTVMRTSPCAFLPEGRWAGVAAFAAALTHGTANAIAAAILQTAIIRCALQRKLQGDDLLGWAQRLAVESVENGLQDVGEWLDGLNVNLEEGFQELVRLLRFAKGVLPRLAADPWNINSDPSVQFANGGWRGHYTLVIALLAIDMFPGDPMQALRRVVVTDGDSDTIAAVAGALLGALYPGVFTKEWEDGLRDRFEPRYIAEIEAVNLPGVVRPK